MLDTLREEFKFFFPAVSKNMLLPQATKTAQGTESFKGFNFQILSFHLFLETDLTVNMGDTCQFFCFPPHSSKGPAHDKASVLYLSGALHTQDR